MVAALVKAHLQGAAVKTPAGRLALHIAVASNAALPVVAALAAAYPEAGAVRDVTGSAATLSAVSSV